MKRIPFRRILLLNVAQTLAVGVLSNYSVAAASADRFGTHTSLPGADPSGQRDSTAAIQHCLASGKHLRLPPGRFLICDTLTVGVHGTRIDGEGALVAAASIRGKSLLRVVANDCRLEGITIENPGRAQSAFGDRTYGIEICGSRNYVRECKIMDFQMCITVAAEGEFFDNLIAFNFCQVIGVGNASGPSGEDRGDGITDWGGRSKIIGNTVAAAPGLGSFNDCRIGIHVEGLSSFAKSTTSADNASASEIIGNFVIPSEDGTGRFRRCYSAEGISHARIIGNYGRGWTWCGIWLVGSSNQSIVSDNILRQELEKLSEAGRAWNPPRAGILIYTTGGVQMYGSRITGNVVQIDAGIHSAIQVRADGGALLALDLSGNTCGMNVGIAGRSDAIVMSGVNDCTLSGSRIAGAWETGVKIVRSRNVSVENCRISGPRGFAVTAESCDDRLQVSMNTFADCGGGIRVSGSSVCFISGNLMNSLEGTAMEFSGAETGFVTNNFSNAKSEIWIGSSRSKLQLSGNIGFGK